MTKKQISQSGKKLEVFTGITQAAGKGCIKFVNFWHDFLKYFINFASYLNDEAIRRNVCLA